LAAVALLLGVGTAQAETVLSYVTPKNLKDSTFRVRSKAGKNHVVEFVIRRDVRKIDGPGRAGYLSNPAIDDKSLGRPMKLEEHDQILTFRFSVPEEQVASTRFTLWGQGLRGEGVTYELKLGDFWKPAK
jgi:hypothetical protein